MWPRWVDAGVWLLVVLTAGVVALFALLLWRDGYVKGWRAARNQAPLCPGCGYNLSGLSECRCPECGKKYTLEQLWRTAVRARTKDAAVSSEAAGAER